ncbi:MAG: hypothetical protein AABX96_04860 [Nanoarchaeota archaeon]
MKEYKRKTPLYKIINGKRVPICDYYGDCANKACREVYPILFGKDGWSYLCRKHFEQEKKRLKDKLAYCTLD